MQWPGGKEWRVSGGARRTAERRDRDQMLRVLRGRELLYSRARAMLPGPRPGQARGAVLGEQHLDRHQARARPVLRGVRAAPAAPLRARGPRVAGFRDALGHLGPADGAAQDVQALHGRADAEQGGQRGGQLRWRFRQQVRLPPLSERDRPKAVCAAPEPRPGRRAGARGAAARAVVPARRQRGHHGAAARDRQHSGLQAVRQ
jgi:hypothetical protein